METIAVLMSTYNGEQYLKQQIESIVCQTIFSKVHLYIRDDGSSDNTKNIIEGFIKQYPSKITAFYQDNQGVNSSFFWLIKNVNGYSYYSICDQDDIWQNDKLEIAVNSLKNEDSDTPLLYASSSFLVHNDLKVYGETRKQRRPITMYNSLIQNISPGHTQVFNEKLRELFLGLEDISNIYYYDSWTLNVAVLLGKLMFDNNSHTLYRQHANNELGAASSLFQKLKYGVKRVNLGHGHKYMGQIKYFHEVYSKELKEHGYYNHVHKLVSKKNFFSRLFFSLGAKFYRQSRIETFGFYLAYILGKF